MNTFIQSTAGVAAKVLGAENEEMKKSRAERGNISRSCFVWWQLSAAASLIIAA